MLSSFLESCYAHLLPELGKSSSVLAFISPQWDMCIMACVQRILEQIFQTVHLLQSESLRLHDSPKEFILKNVICSSLYL